MGKLHRDAQLIAGGLFGLVKEITAAYTIKTKDHLVLGDTTAGAMTATLPKLSQAYDTQSQTGQIVVVVLDVDGGDLTIDGDGSETIGGSANLVLGDAGDVAVLQASSDDWIIRHQPNLGTSDIADLAVTTAKLAADAVTGAKLADNAADSEHYTDASIDPVHLATGLQDDDQGRACVGYFYCTGAVADTELVTINGRTHEFDNDSTFTGDVQVDVTGDLSADAACIALAAAINADASRSVDAVVMAGNNDTTAGCMFVAKVVGATNFTTTTDVTNGGVVSAATMLGAAAVADVKTHYFTYAATAADVTLWALVGGDSVPIAGVVSTTQPVLRSVLVQLAAGGWVVPVVTVVFTWLQANTNFWILVVDDSAATITALDTINVVVTT